MCPFLTKYELNWSTLRGLRGKYFACFILYSKDKIALSVNSPTTNNRSMVHDGGVASSIPIKLYLRATPGATRWLECVHVRNRNALNN